MEKKKYISSNEIVYICLNRVQMGIDDTMIDLYFLEDELAGEKKDFIKGLGVVMVHALRKAAKCEVCNHNLNDCVKSRYIRMFIYGEADFDKIKSALIKSCEYIETVKPNRTSTHPNNVLFYKHEAQIRAYATEIKNDLINGTDYTVRSQYFPDY